MNLLAPLFLVGLAALAVPVLVHLTHKERREPVVFPSLMFLRTIPYKSERKQRIRNWLLFLLRVAAVLLVVFAFARPWLTGSSAALAQLGQARDVVILLDRSYSMGFGDRWQQALTAATRVVNGLGPDDQATIVTFDDQAEAANRPSSDRAALRAILSAAKPGDGRTRYAPALALARDILAQSERPRRDVWLISDFQRNGWGGRGDVRLPAGVAMQTVDVSGTDAAPNRTVAGIVLDRAAAAGQGRGRVTVTARVTSRSGHAVPAAEQGGRRVEAALDLGGQEVRTAAATLPLDGAVNITFAAVPVPDRPTLGRVRLVSGDELPLDDAFQFVLLPPAAVNVLVVTGDPARALYLSRALGIGSDPAFHVTTVRGGALQPRDLAGQRLVIVNDAALPSAALRRLHDFVRQGGGALLVLGQDAGGAVAQTFPELLARDPGAPVDRLEDRGGVVSIVDFHHPAFQPFAEPRSGDFSAARFFRYRRMTPATGATTLMRFDDGAAALVEARVDSGQVMALASDLSNSWNDLPLQPVFLPFLHQVALHLARYVDPPAWRIVGQVIDLKDLPAWAARANPAEEIVVEPPLGARESRHPGGEEHLRLDQAGFYRVHPLDTRQNASLIAVNPDIAESDLGHVDPEVIAAQVVTGGSRLAQAPNAEPLGPAQLERRQGLWWYLLMAAMLLLVSETIVGRAMAPVVRA